MKMGVPKFKAGDKAIIIGDLTSHSIGSHQCRLGEIVTIHSVKGQLFQGQPTYRITKSEGWTVLWTVFECDLEPLVKLPKRVINLKEVLADFRLSEKDIEEVIDLINLKKAIRELKPVELTCEEI
jgi:hypothetical protein